MKTQNAIRYSGFATLKKMRGKTVVQEYMFHNNGTNYLFQALASTLCGYDRTNDMPKYFDLGSTDNSGNYKCFLANRAYLTSRIVTDYQIDPDTDRSVAAIFTAYIPSSSIVNHEDSVDTLALYSTYSFGDNNTTRLAEIKISDVNQQFKLSDSKAHSYILEWAMTFNNATTANNKE